MESKREGNKNRDAIAHLLLLLAVKWHKTDATTSRSGGESNSYQSSFLLFFFSKTKARQRMGKKKKQEQKWGTGNGEGQCSHSSQLEIYLQKQIRTQGSTVQRGAKGMAREARIVAKPL